MKRIPKFSIILKPSQTHLENQSTRSLLSSIIFAASLSMSQIRFPCPLSSHSHKAKGLEFLPFPLVYTTGAPIARTHFKANELLVHSAILVKMRGRGLPEGRAESTWSHPFRPHVKPRSSPSVQPLLPVFASSARSRAPRNRQPDDCVSPQGNHLSRFRIMLQLSIPLFLQASSSNPSKRLAPIGHAFAGTSSQRARPT